MQRLTKSSLSHFSMAAREDGAESGALELLLMARHVGVDLESGMAVKAFSDHVAALYDPIKEQAEIAAIEFFTAELRQP